VKLVASMMVGPAEADRYLAPCLEHLAEFCDEICVRWEGEPGTMWEPGDGFPLRILNAEPTFFAHEGRARQELLDFTLAAEPTHVLAIDADEFIADGALLRDTLSLAEPATEPTGWSICMQEVWNITGLGLELRQDGGWEEHDVPIVWEPGPRPSGLAMPDRALACGRTPTQMRARAGHVGTAILHFGWACRAEREARWNRYVVHDGGKHHQSAHLDSIMWDDEAVKLVRVGWPPALWPYAERISAYAGVTG
jgi:hypothetical protein